MFAKSWRMLQLELVNVSSHGLVLVARTSLVPMIAPTMVCAILLMVVGVISFGKVQTVGILSAPVTATSMVIVRHLVMLLECHRRQFANVGKVGVAQIVQNQCVNNHACLETVSELAYVNARATSLALDAINICALMIATTMANV